MIVEFKGSFTIDGETFGKGEHVIGKKVSDHWYTKALIQDGLVAVLKDDDIDAEVVESEDSLEEVGEAQEEIQAIDEDSLEENSNEPKRGRKPRGK